MVKHKDSWILEWLTNTFKGFVTWYSTLSSLLSLYHGKTLMGRKIILCLYDDNVEFINTGHINVYILVLLLATVGDSHSFWVFHSYSSLSLRNWLQLFFCVLRLKVRGHQTKIHFAICTIRHLLSLQFVTNHFNDITDRVNMTALTFVCCQTSILKKPDLA